MSQRGYRLIQALIFLGLFFFLMAKVINNQVLWYINKRFLILTEIGIGLLIILAHDFSWRFASHIRHIWTKKTLTMNTGLSPLIYGS